MEPSENELERAFQEAVKDTFAGAQPQKHPVAVIIGGQPGAGKSRLTVDARAELMAEGGSITIDVDKLRKYIPDYVQFMKEDDTTAASKTHKTAVSWGKRLGEMAIARRFNVILDQTSKTPEILCTQIKQFQDAGYPVELRIQSASFETSQLRTYWRYEKQKITDGYARYCSADVHEKGYSGVPESVEAAQRGFGKGIRPNRIMIQDCYNNTIYDNRLVKNTWEHSRSAKEALTKDRERPMNKDERQNFNKTYEKVLTAMYQRKAPPEQISLVIKSWQAAHKSLDQKEAALTRLPQTQIRKPQKPQPDIER